MSINSTTRADSSITTAGERTVLQNFVFFKPNTVWNFSKYSSITPAFIYIMILVRICVVLAIYLCACWRKNRAERVKPYSRRDGNNRGESNLVTTFVFYFRVVWYWKFGICLNIHLYIFCYWKSVCNQKSYDWAFPLVKNLCYTNGATEGNQIWSQHLLYIGAVCC